MADGRSQADDDTVFTQSLPVVEALNLNSNGNDSEVTVGGVACSEQHSPINTNKLQLSVNCSEGNNLNRDYVSDAPRKCKQLTCSSDVAGRPRKVPNKHVTLPGNQGAGEVHELHNQTASLPCMADNTSSHHQDGVTDVDQHGKRHASKKRPSRKVSAQQKDSLPPVRVTRSTSKLMAQQPTAAAVGVTSGQRSCDQNAVMEDNPVTKQSHCNVHTEASQIKYNHNGFSKVTNWTVPEKRTFTNNGTTCDTHHSICMNRNGSNKGSHFISDDDTSSDSVQPLQDVTNSTNDTTAVGRPHHFTQSGRAYDLVAGKKSKKGKRQQQVRKTQPHKKKHTTSDNTSTTQLTGLKREDTKSTSPNDNEDRSTVMKDDLQGQHGSQLVCRNSGELVSEYKCSLYME